MLLGLHRAGKKSVLDLGCGMGYFLLATEIFGHSPLGIDIAESEKYQDVIDFLKLERVIFEIKAGLPLPPLGRTFDLVTAFQVTFNNLDRPDQWGPSEWNFFLKDVGSHMNPGGELFLQLNPTKEGFLYGEDLRALYLRKGATLRGSTVRLPASGLLKE
jgi:SAM-dependent methyltransferase